MFHQRLQKIGSLLGLLAILVATLAPTVSQALAASRGETAMAGAHCSMPSMQHEASNDRSGRHSSLSAGDACGYCSLFAHMPVVHSPQGIFAITIRANWHPVATRFKSVRRVETLTSVQPRAPPSLS